MAEWKDVGAGIANVAPALGALVGSIFPGVGTALGTGAGVAIKAIASAFGLGMEATPDQVMTAIQTDPQAMVKLKIAEMDYLLKKGDQENEKMRIEIDALKAKNEVYIEELRTRTVPWIDAAHKMGRQILLVLNLAAVVAVLLWSDKEITGPVALLLGVPNTTYQYVKGAGYVVKEKLGL